MSDYFPCNTEPKDFILSIKNLRFDMSRQKGILWKFRIFSYQTVGHPAYKEFPKSWERELENEQPNRAIRLNEGFIERGRSCKRKCVRCHEFTRACACTHVLHLVDNTTNNSILFVFFFVAVFFCFVFFGQYSSGSTPLTGMEAGLLTTTTSSSMCITVIGSEVTGTSCLQHNRKPA